MTKIARIILNSRLSWRGPIHLFIHISSSSQFSRIQMDKIPKWIVVFYQIILCRIEALNYLKCRHNLQIISKMHIKQRYFSKKNSWESSKETEVSVWISNISWTSCHLGSSTPMKNKCNFWIKQTKKSAKIWTFSWF